MIKKLKELITFVGLDFKKEMIKLVLIDSIISISAVIILFLFKNILVSIFVLLLSLIIDYLFIYLYQNKKRVILQSREDEFITLIYYFQMFSSNGHNIYHSFELASTYLSKWMQNRITEFLNEMDIDKSIQPFVNFSSNFKLPIANNIMLSIYQMVDSGSINHQLNEFTILFDSVNKAHQKNLIDKKQRSLDTVSSYPLVGAGLIVILLMFSILSIMGDMINVI